MSRHLRLPFLTTVFALTLAGCAAEDETQPTSRSAFSVVPPPDSVAADEFYLAPFADDVTVVEGAAAVSLPIEISRGSEFDGEVTLSIDDPDGTGVVPLEAVLTTALVKEGSRAPALELSIPLSTAPIPASTLPLTVRAMADGSEAQASTVNVVIDPIDAPDVYLLIGQSNMVGESEVGARQAGPGGPDAPDPRILQLNVTANERSVFSRAESFSRVSTNVVEPPLLVAADPLHPDPGGQSDTQIGPGLSFAKAALADTTADIVLVPAAWGGTGFCGVPELLTAWNPRPAGNDSLGGTGLFERAVARTNAALELSDGILRGILWLQGETDGENPTCAALYERNLDDLVRALRTDIKPDARGSAARGPGAPIPFVAGTLSRGGEFAAPTAARAQVDQALRTLGSRVAHADTSNHDDLVPPAYPCGIGGCIHFGAAAYREIGSRYYERLRELAIAAD